jgi:hypothetical protein
MKCAECAPTISSFTSNRLEHCCVVDPVRGEYSRIAKQTAPTCEVKWVACEIRHTSAGFFNQ